VKTLNLCILILIFAVGSTLAGKPPKPPQAQGLFITNEIADSDVNSVPYSIQSDGTGVYKDGLNGGLSGDVSVLMSNVCNGLLYGDRLLDLAVRQVKVTLTSANALQPGDYGYQVPAQPLGTVLNSVRMMNKLTCPDNKSMLNMTAGSKLFAEMHLRFAPMDATTNYYRLDMGVADEVETQKVQIFCNSVDSMGCKDWDIDPISDPDYTENPGRTRARLNYITTHGRGSTTNKGAFYMTFHIHVTRL
jgi:hypothetical protein